MSYTTSRVKLGSKNIINLPDHKPDKKESIKMGGTKISIHFGDLFEPTGIKKKWVPMIPYFYDGMLYRTFLIKNKEQNKDYSHGNVEKGDPVVVPSYINGMKRAILFHYNHQTNYSDLFEKAGSILKKGDVLVIPMIGTNNSINYFQCACNIYYALKSLLQSDGENESLSNLCKLSEIKIITQYSENKYGSSVRAIGHLFNLFEAHKAGEQETKCLICYSNQVDTIFNCGHRICCRSCSEHFMECPLCKKHIAKKYECYEIIDKTSFKCCCNYKNKADLIFSPCGHYKSGCDKCVDNSLSENKCIICKQQIMMCSKIFGI